MTTINLKLDCETEKLMWTYDFGKYFMCVDQNDVEVKTDVLCGESQRCEVIGDPKAIFCTLGCKPFNHPNVEFFYLYYRDK